MKKLTIEDVLNKDIMDLIIPSDQVAHVQVDNPLEHALLVLVKTGYSAIPVLDASYKLRGIVSKTLILDFILGIERIEFEKLSDHRVSEVMKTSMPILKTDDPFIEAVKLSINETFLCVEDENHIFQGILPRSALLKFLNHYLRDKNTKKSVSL
ncbi:putative transcriptional regulator [Scopulibacillus daqui]|uniref:Transcriptional regulator n=1 Tax=Scopulibacillus daqui TaxID=1469162 RepID=A0ABS2Q073_9BACL|nr:cyclic-di-AMP-binding protein CbpB [Scopulibacillus daqui]MBM7645703.1 putative transcriptional regulator [Scopulibacillus daqui]